MDDDDNEEAREDRDGRNKSRAGVANIGEKISDAAPRWLGCENKYRRCNNESMESGWTLKDRKTETDVIRKDMKEKQVKIHEAQDRRTWRLKTRCADPK